MIIEKAHQQLVETLVPEFGKGEATQMARIVFEDIFSITNFLRKDELTTAQLTRLSEVQTRLLAHEPVQYVVGMTYFYDLKFDVSPAVLIPRPETEELVHWILSEHANDPPLSVLDIGTGSGCIPISIKNKAPQHQVSALDVSREALTVGRLNAQKNNTEISFINLDILDKSEWQKLSTYQLIVSNPPYIPDAEKQLMAENVLEHEPQIALFVPDRDPLLFYRTIIHFANQHLTPGGTLFFEINEHNAFDVRKLLVENEYVNIQIKQDLQQKDRMIKASKKK